MQDDSISLNTLLALLADTNPDPGHLFREGLALLLRYSGADRAMLALQSPQELEIIAWATPEGSSSPDWDPLPATPYCHGAMGTAPAPLILPDLTLDPAWQAQDLQELGIQAYMGVPIGRLPSGVLSLQSAQPRAFQESELLFAQGLAALFARVLETAQLREELFRKEQLLDLHSAVADDNALEHPRSQLPTRRYLEIWVRANLSRARRSGEKLGVAVFDSRWLPDADRSVEALVQHLRGEDILVDLGNHQILLAAPASNQLFMEGLLRRIYGIFGTPLPMGVTLCDPETDVEGSVPSLAPAIERARQALMESMASMGKSLTWRLPSGVLA